MFIQFIFNDLRNIYVFILIVSVLVKCIFHFSFLLQTFSCFANTLSIHKLIVIVTNTICTHRNTLYYKSEIKKSL